MGFGHGEKNNQEKINRVNENNILLLDKNSEYLIEQIKNSNEIILENKIKIYPKSLYKYQNNIILKQMDKSIFKIYYQNKNGTCFLCPIPISNSFHLLPVLITCYHNLDNKFIGNTIKLVNDEKEKIILIDESRRIYKNEEYNIIIIELKENEFNNEEFLKVDDDVYKGNKL